MYRRAQAAMEFLMTYGWAILIMLIVIAVLFFLGVFNSGTSVPSSCTLPAGFTCAEFSLDSSGRLYLDLGQATGKTVTVTGVGCGPSGSGMTNLSLPVTVQTGSHAVVSDSDIACSGNYSGAFKGKLSIRYQPAGASYNKTITGDLSAPVAVVSAGEQDQWNSSYSYYRQVTVNTGVSSNLTNFPAYFVLDTQHLIAYGRMNSTCKDLRVVNSTKNGVMDYEIENNTCNTTSTVVWFRVPQTNAATDYTAYVFYGNNSAADAQNRVGVWSNGYAGVWHAGDVLDSANGLACTNVSMGASANGKFGRTYNDNAVASHYVNCGTSSVFDLGASSFSISAWLNLNGINGYPPGSGPTVFYIFDRSQYLSDGYQLRVQNSSTTITISVYTWQSGTGTAQTSVSQSYPAFLGSWHHVAGTKSGNGTGSVKLYYDGTDVTGTPVNISNGITNPSRDALIGKWGSDATYKLNGSMDEIRVSNVARSADWIRAEYGQTYSVGSEQVN